jgi:hypothetical protein
MGHNCSRLGWISRMFFAVLLAFTALFVGSVSAQPNHDAEHYTAVGFFDIHVCNWPQVPLFFLALFSTTHFDQVESIALIQPDGKELGKFDLERFRIMKTKKGAPPKRVFITYFDVPEGAPDGWYTAHVKMKDGRGFVGRDYVVITTMPRATGMLPANGSEDIPVPRDLRWDPVPGAAYYQVFVKDVWEAKVVYESPLLQIPQAKLPEGLIRPGGYYSWRVHARDVNGHALLGDFNDGSLSKEAEFSVTTNQKRTAR